MSLGPNLKMSGILIRRGADAEHLSFITGEHEKRPHEDTGRRQPSAEAPVPSRP